MPLSSKRFRQGQSTACRPWQIASPRINPANEPPAQLQSYGGGHPAILKVRMLLRFSDGQANWFENDPGVSPIPAV
jgi:hypothetical protein